MTRRLMVVLHEVALLILCTCMSVGCHVPHSESGLRATDSCVGVREAARLAQMYHDADLVLVCHLRGFRVSRHARTPLESIEVLRGDASSGRTIIACYHLTPATDFPKPGSRWVVFLQKPHLIEDGLEYRYVVGEPLEQIGIIAATPERIELLKKAL